MPGPTPAQQLAAYQMASGQVRASVLRYADLYWGTMGAYRDADIDRMVAAIVPRVQAGQVRIAELTAAYLGALAGQIVPVQSALVTGGRGVPGADVYRRPGTVVYAELAAGKPLSKAADSGKQRLLSLTGMDLQMAKVRQASVSLQGSRFRAYRRVLTRRENCAMCIIASTQRYTVEDLLPIHPGCDCDVEPIGSDEPLPQVLDEQLLEATHSRVADFAGSADRSGRAPDYLQLITTHVHGEHGPSLRWRDQKFTGPADH